jgi:hypothetical protein
MRNTDRFAERLHTAADLWATGVALQRQTIHRRHPEASEAEVEARLTRWLRERPGAEAGDGPQPSNR